MCNIITQNIVFPQEQMLILTFLDVIHYWIYLFFIVKMFNNILPNIFKHNIRQNSNVLH